MKNLPSDVQAYVEALPEHRRTRLRRLFRRIRDRFPRAEVSMRYRMPTFEFGEAWMAIASQKSYVSVYTCARPHIEPYLAVHPETKSGKGCLNFPDSVEIDLEALDAVIDHALSAPAKSPHGSTKRAAAPRSAKSPKSKRP